MRSRRLSKVTAVVLVMMLVLGTALLAGCGGTKESPGGPAGTGAPGEVKQVPDSVRGEVLDTLKGLGVKYDETVMSIAYGDTDRHIIVRGAMSGPTGLGTPSVESTPVAKYSEINLDLRNGGWQVSETK